MGFQPDPMDSDTDDDGLTDYQEIKAVYGFTSDQRIGDSHLHVPGPDGRLGFGGTCFPKDLNAFNSVFNSIVLSKIIEYNKELRDDLE